MNDLKKLILVLVVIFILLPQSALSERKLRIGVIQSTSGIAAEDGKTVVQALQLAADQLKQDNITLDLYFEDDKTSPKDTVTAYQKLKSKGVDAIIGATWDFTTNTLTSLAGRDQLVLFNTSTLPESINTDQANGFAFINAVSTYEEAGPYKDFLEAKDLKSVVIIYANNSWGETQRSVYKEIISNSGIKVIGEYSSVSFDQNEWQNLLPQIRSKKPGSILLLLNKNDLDIFLKRSRELDFKPKVFASKNAFDALRTTRNIELYEGLCFTYPYEQLSAHEEFANSYSKRFGEKPRIYADNTYDALFILARAHQISVAEKVTLKDALTMTEYSGLVGKYRYSEKSSFSLGKASLMCVKEGKARLISGQK